LHSVPIVYSNSNRVGKCSVGGEPWHRDVVACINLLLRASLGDGSHAPSLGGLRVYESPVPLGSAAAHDPTLIPREAWARRKPLDATNKYKLMRMSI
jgi:putative transposase